MQFWNVLHVACWKYMTQKIAKNSPSGHRRTTLSGYVFTTKASIDNRKKLVRQQYLPQQYLRHMSSQYGELLPTSGWDRFGCLGHPCKFQRVSRLGSVTVWHSSSGRQPNCGALDRERHLYMVGRPSRSAHISSWNCFCCRLKHQKDLEWMFLMRCLKNDVEWTVFC